MRKTIYDEVLDILVDSDDDCYMFNRSQMNKISKALKQAQKQEKLLNKIKEIIDREDDSYILSYILEDSYYISSLLEESRRYYEINKLIKEIKK